MTEALTIRHLKYILADDPNYEVTYEGETGVTVLLLTDYVLSIQWGPGNYCSNKVAGFVAYPVTDVEQYWDCENAEIAIWTVSDTEFIQFEGWTDEVAGWVPVDQILRIAEYLSGQGPRV